MSKEEGSSILGVKAGKPEFLSMGFLGDVGKKSITGEDRIVALCS